MSQILNTFNRKIDNNTTSLLQNIEIDYASCQYRTVLHNIVKENRIKNQSFLIKAKNDMSIHNNTMSLLQNVKKV